MVTRNEMAWLRARANAQTRLERAEKRHTLAQERCDHWTMPGSEPAWSPTYSCCVEVFNAKQAVHRAQQVRGTFDKLPCPSR